MDDNSADDDGGIDLFTDERAASEVVGVVLLIGIVALGFVSILLIGGPQLAAEQDRAEVGQAEQSLTQFDSEASRVATGSTSSQRVDLGLRGNRGTLDVQNDTGQITVELESYFDPGNDTEVMNASMGTMVYESGETTVGYQGGGVWRSDGNRSTMVSPPQISFRNGTLAMPMVKTTRGGSVYSDVQVTPRGTTQQFPTANETNKIRGNKALTVTVESRYCTAWRQFFEDETDAIVNADCDQDTVKVVFLALPLDYSPDAGVVATSGPGEIRLEGNGAYVDSYTSPEYDGGDADGVVEAAGDVKMFGSSQIDGDVRSGRNISIESGDAQIDGNANWTESFDPQDDDSVTEADYQIDGVQEIPPINRLVSDKADELEATNDNAEAGTNGDLISDETLDIDGDQGRLEAGEYYLETLELEDETLYLDTTDGDVTIAVEKWVKLDERGNDPSEIVVEGDGDVQLFVASEETVSVDNIQGAGGAGFGEAHFVAEGANVTVPNRTSPQLQVFAPDNFIGAVGGGSTEVTAAVIGPAGEDGPGKFYVKKGDVYGAIVTGNLTVGQDGAVHFDRALLDEEIPLAPNVPRIEYVYITEYEIRVEGA